MKEKAGGYISKLHFNDATDLEIQQNSIVIFVGPNNAGKSQALKDIYNLSEKKISSVVVSDIEITKSQVPISSVLNTISIGKNYGSRITYNVLGYNLNLWNNSDIDFPKQPYYGEYRNLFIANLDTSARLTICNAPNNINRNEPRTHPIHYAEFDSTYRKWLSQNFKKAFGVEITPNSQYGASVPLCIGDPVKLDGIYEDEQARQEAYGAILETYKQVQNQGDGIKSFTGILLYLMLDYYCTYLIDEPESFLHPPQARIMGQIIGRTLCDNQQAFISTHSEELIKGLVEACPDRIKIVRITREGDDNFFSILESETFNNVWSDPLLKYSNIMSSLFHKSVVLCESDSDCKIYSIIENYLKQSKGLYSETLFIHCGGKHRMSKVATALRTLDIKVKLIPDIDVLNDETVFRGIAHAFGIEWDVIRPDYNIIVSNLHSTKEKVNRTQAKAIINQVLDGSQTQELSKSEIKEIREAINTVSKWDNIKTFGVVGLPAGDSKSAYDRMDSLLRSKGIFIVPVGELEGFIKEVGGHGPEWTNHVLEKYPDLDNEIYKPIKDFIGSIDL